MLSTVSILCDRQCTKGELKKFHAFHPDSREKALPERRGLSPEQSHLLRLKPKLHNLLRHSQYAVFSTEADRWGRHSTVVETFFHLRQNGNIGDSADIVRSLMSSAADAECLLHCFERAKFESHFVFVLVGGDNERKETAKYRRRNVASNATDETNFTLLGFSGELTGKRNLELVSKIVNGLLHFLLETKEFLVFFASLQGRDGALVLKLL